MNKKIIFFVAFSIIKSMVFADGSVSKDCLKKVEKMATGTVEKNKDCDSKNVILTRTQANQDGTYQFIFDSKCKSIPTLNFQCQKVQPCLCTRIHNL